MSNLLTRILVSTLAAVVTFASFGCMRTSDLIALDSGESDTDTAPQGIDSDSEPPREPVLAAVVADFHSCALFESGNVGCWGFVDFAGYSESVLVFLGDDEPASERPGFVDLGGGISQISSAGHHACALTVSGEVVCWGSNLVGQLGHPGLQNSGVETPPSADGFVTTAGTATQVSAGTVHTCVLIETGEVECWGDNGHGQLGYFVGDGRSDRLVDIGSTIVQVSAGAEHTCAADHAGSVYCWGNERQARTGYGTELVVGLELTPAEAGPVDVGAEVVQVAAGGFHTCALTTEGQVKCWGLHSEGELGLGVLTQPPEDQVVSALPFVELGEPATKVVAGAYHSCALLESGDLRCWGSNSWGQIGYPGLIQLGLDETPISVAPVDVGDTVVDVVAGAFQTCAVLISGDLRCWGRNDFGQLGYGDLKLDPTNQTVGDDETPASKGDVPLW